MAVTTFSTPSFATALPRAAATQAEPALLGRLVQVCIEAQRRRAVRELLRHPRFASLSAIEDLGRRPGELLPFVRAD
jgi:hypothetical protein